MKIDKEELKKICNLARLQIEPENFDNLLDEFNHILNYIEEIKALDFSEIKEEKRKEEQHIFREDKIISSLPKEKIENIAPDFQNSYFIVPRVIET